MLLMGMPMPVFACPFVKNAMPTMPMPMCARTYFNGHCPIVPIIMKTNHRWVRMVDYHSHTKNRPGDEPWSDLAIANKIPKNHRACLRASLEIHAHSRFRMPICKYPIYLLATLTLKAVNVMHNALAFFSPNNTF